MATAALPLFHLYGDPPDDQAFDFIHIETISSRSSIHDWTIRAHRHRNLFQILLIEKGGGEMTFEAAVIAFEAPCAILVPATTAHGFRFRIATTDGWVMTFTEDVAEAMGDRRGEALARLKALAAAPIVPLIAVEVARLAAGRWRGEATPVTLEPTWATVEALRQLVEEHFHRERQLSFYAGRLAMTVDRLNDHVRRATGVTAGHLIRQRVLTEAKRQLVFTSLPIHEIAYDLAFSDPSHFARFFRKQTGTTPHEFRAARGG
jgi:AraC family transcriptional activator of pobA